MFRYAIKRVVRSYKLFLALTLGILVATTFFASTNVAADLLARDSLNSSLDGVVYDAWVNTQYSNWTSDEFENLESELAEIEEVTGYTRVTSIPVVKNETIFNMYGTDMESDAAAGLQVVSGKETLDVNETYIIAGSVNESLFEIGEEVQARIVVLLGPTNSVELNWTFEVVGYASLPEDRRLNLQQNPASGILLSQFGFQQETPYNMMLADWQKSMVPILSYTDTFENKTATSITNSVHLKIDRDSLIDPYNIEASITRLQDTYSKIQSRADAYDAQVSSALVAPLILYSIVAALMNLQFIVLSIPIFFMAYFTGTMVSDVSYNLRRREIGLLLTKGYKRGTIRNMFLIEGMLIGALAGAASVFLGTAVSYIALEVTSLDYFTVVTNNTTSIIISIIIGMILALISVWRPANRAAKLEILDALKQYVLVEETSEYKRLLPTLSFLLGTYKIIVWILGVDINILLTTVNFGNFFLSLLVVIWIGIDGVLNFVGPIMFLFGATKLFMRGSQRFQELIVNIGSRFFGAFGKLATRNVKRNPARNAAMVFLISLIVSYGVFAVGSLYTQYDRTERTAQYNVGSDISIELESGANLTEIMDLAESYEEVISVTAEYQINLRSGDASFETRGVSPSQWLETAFWEPGWFVGDVDTMFDELEDDGIILSVTVANNLDLSVGDSMNVRGPLDDEVHSLRIVGLIGYTSVIEDFLRDVGATVEGDYPSFVSESFLNDTGLIDRTSRFVLADTASGTNGTELEATMIEEINGIYRTNSVTSQLVQYTEQPIQSGVTKIQWVAITFAVILAMVGTGLVIVLTLREKDAEIALITVRGFSKWQLFRTLLAEMLVMVVFSLLLGTFVGLVQIFGNVSQINSGLTGLIQSRVVIGGYSGLIMLIIVGVVLLAAALPVYMSSRKPETKVDVLRA